MMSDAKFEKGKTQDAQNIHEFLVQRIFNHIKQRNPNDTNNTATSIFHYQTNTPVDNDYTDVEDEISNDDPR